MISRRVFNGLLVGAGAALALPATAAAQDVLPQGPVTLIVPFAAGGATDLVGRLLARKLAERIDRNVLVENVVGAGGSLGAGSMVKAAPDGSRLLLGTVATHAIQPLIARPRQYDPQKDFTPISMVARVPIVLLVNKDVPATNVQELIALLRKEPDGFVYGSSGAGTPLHLSGELFKFMAGVEIEHVPYTGGALAMNDLISGQIPVFFEVMTGAANYIRDGAVRALAVTTKERLPTFPDLPTIAESGLPDYETYTWNAVFGPPGMSPDVVRTLNEQIVAVTAEEDFRNRMLEVGAVAAGSSPNELAAEVSSELAKWAPVIERSHLSNG